MLVGIAALGWTGPWWGARSRSGAGGVGQGHRRLSTRSMGSTVTTWADLGYTGGTGRTGWSEGRLGTLAWAERPSSLPPLCPSFPPQ